MRRWFAAALMLARTLMPGVSPGQEHVTAIRNVTVFTGTDASVITHATIVIRGRLIEAVGPSDTVQIPLGALVVDGRGRFVMPGLIDTHVHIASSIGTPDMERLLSYELANGITGLRDASGMGHERELCTLRDQIEAGGILAPRLYVSGSATPQNLERYHARDWPDLLGQLRALRVDGYKLRNLTRAQADTVIRLVHALGFPVYGHTYGPGFNLDNFSLDALDAGAVGIMHISGAGPADSLKWRQIDAVGGERTWLGLYLHWLDASEAELDRFAQALLTHHAWLEPTLTAESFILYEKRYRNPPEIPFPWTSSAEIRSGFPNFTGGDLELARKGFKCMQAFVQRFQAAGGMLLAGTDMLPWPGSGLHEELRLLVESGLSPKEALQAATRNPARAFGWDGHTGTIAVGLDADLVFLDADPLQHISNTTRIWAVVRAGHLLDRTALDRLLAGGETVHGR